MNQLLLLPEEELRPGIYRLSGPRAQHVINVLEAKPGTILHVGLLEGALGKGQVCAIANNILEIEVNLNQAPPPRPTTRLILGIPRPKVLRRLLPQLVSFGLDEIVLLRAWRVDRSYLESDVLSAQTIKTLVLEGLMQSCSTHEPRVHLKPRFRPYVEDELAAESDPQTRWVAHPRAAINIAELPALAGKPWTVAIGPERGFLDEEVTFLEQAGFTAARITGPILRVDTACIAAIAQAELRAAQP